MAMKKAGLVVAMTLAMVAGCSTPTVVTLQNGTQYITKKEPKYKDGMVQFEDISGKVIQVDQDEVATMIPKD